MLTKKLICDIIMLALQRWGVSFLLGERKWQHQNVKILFLLAQNVKRETMRQAKTQQQTQSELK